MRRIGIVIIVSALLGALPGAADAAGPLRAYSLARDDVRAPSGARHDLRLDFLLMREAYNVRRAGSRLVLGTKSRCRPRGTIELELVRGAGEAADVASARLSGELEPEDVSVRPDGSAFAVTSGPRVDGVLVSPTRIARTWLVLRVRSSVYELCSTGHWREEWSEPLARSLESAQLRVLPAAARIAAPGRWGQYEVERRRGARTLEIEGIALPDTFRPRVTGERLTLGPAGPCAIRGSLRLDLVTSKAKTGDAVVRELTGAAAGAVRHAAWVRAEGGSVRGLSVVGTRFEGRWLVARVDVAGREPGTGGCRAADYRRGYAAPLEVALQTMTGYVS